jgi:hypothetical protein
MADQSLQQKQAAAGSPEIASQVPDSSVAAPEFSISFSEDIRNVVGELPSEQKSGRGTGGQQQTQTKSPSERKEELLARLPKDQEKAERFMYRQVKQTLDHELDELEGKLGKHLSAFDLNNVVARIREFREILGQLAHMAFEQLKTLWLRFVHHLSV